ncbi:tryptophan--tRNA ligase [Candidatus Kaiserbacteria bacterium CG_4_8_14_3_um_filter_38_9]|uniref:Tryptophan--tRNA ligase n=1 Tax=Candidatus Kaiserbacteria bacterium CG_4_8_14_3_um_filter_38_9 TaxID=1974599 RepID=A0A2M7IN50_9BACT|nr:MAG: tryptophan--tRNA ligase [Candidatus Kaiserbacteria bacterium CG_4_8_14_3_um_filter_38_9]
MKTTTILTGLQPSGNLHIGNYFGSIKPFLDLYNEQKDSANFFLMVADYHALTTVRDGSILRRNIYNIVRDYLATGVDPNTVTLFRQSDNSDHLELGWILDCMVSVPFLMLAHSYKDKIAKGLDANAGLFTYPMLMAADILLYNTDLVPVGEDQRQHLEYAREAVTKFNNAYGQILKEPKEVILKNVGVVPGTDGQKMSKSYGNIIPLFGTREEIQKAVMSIVTDSTGERPENVYAIHSLFRSKGQLESLYSEHVGQYKYLKEALIEDIDSLVAPMREKRNDINDGDIRKILVEGVEKAKIQSTDTLRKVRDAIGINI